MESRWKGEEAKRKALTRNISEIVSQLQASLISSNSRGILSGGSVLLNANVEQTELLDCAYLGTPTTDNGQCFKLCMEETFYLQYSLKCIKVIDHNGTELNDDELWKHMTSLKENFPILFKAYSHLRTKNWVVISGFLYGVDFVAYRHHPEYVHSEYGVLALSSENGSANDRLRVWSDLHGTVRLLGNVSKTTLVIYIDTQSCATSPSCLDNYVVQERTITRWRPENSRETKVKYDSEG